MKRSAGIIAYKIENNEIKVLLCHYGGPFFIGIDDGGWSIPKGEIEKNENVIDTARREFKEETNLDVNTEIKYLASKKISRKKLVIMFYTNSDFDLSNCRSNTFEMEYPFKSNNIETFLEMDKYEWMSMDKYEWMSLDIAKIKIVKSQLYFIERLENILL